MVVHKKREPAYASSTLTIGDLTRVNQALVIEEWSRLLSTKPRRRIGRMLQDFAWVAGGWLFFIGVITQPIAQLIGLAVCGIALLVLSPEQRSMFD